MEKKIVVEANEMYFYFRHITQETYVVKETTHFLPLTLIHVSVGQDFLVRKFYHVQK